MFSEGKCFISSKHKWYLTKVFSIRERLIIWKIECSVSQSSSKSRGRQRTTISTLAKRYSEEVVGIYHCQKNNRELPLVITIKGPRNSRSFDSDVLPISGTQAVWKRPFTGKPLTNRPPIGFLRQLAYTLLPNSPKWLWPQMALFQLQ